MRLSETKWTPSPEWLKELDAVTEERTKLLSSLKGTEVKFDSGHGVPIKAKVKSVTVDRGNPVDYNPFTQEGIQRKLIGGIELDNGDKIRLYDAIDYGPDKKFHPEFYHMDMGYYDISPKRVLGDKDDPVNILKRGYPILKSKHLADEIRAVGEWHSKMPDPAKKDAFIKKLLKIFKSRHDQRGSRSVDRELMTYINYAREHGFDYPEFKTIEKSLKANEPSR